MFGRLRRFLIPTWLMALLAAVPSFAGHSSTDRSFRVGFSKAMFSDVNDTDAKAAVKAWAISIAEERDIRVDPDPQVYSSPEALAEALASHTVDAAGITAAEYFAMEGASAWGPVFAAAIGDEITSTYYLIVHRESAISGIADLRGKRLLLHENPRACLAEPWLRSLLRERRLEPNAGFFGSLIYTTKLSQVVLPVFFRKADACVVTRHGFDTLTELNPQLARDLVVIEISPALLATVFSFRGDYTSPVMDKLMSGMRELHLSPSGRQVLTIFHSDRMVEVSPAALETARALLTSQGVSHD